jgi:hypothetical protein
MARKSGEILQKHLLITLRAIGDFVPRLPHDERADVFVVLTAILEYLQEHQAGERDTEFAAVEAELAAAFKRSPAPRARSRRARWTMPC